MRLAGQSLLTFAIFCHRWLAVVLCLLFVLWFVSGFVMMYWGFPEITPEQRLAKAESLTPASIRISPEAAYGKLRQPDPPNAARIDVLDNRPVYRFQTGQAESIVFADAGDPLVSVPQEMALSIATRWSGQLAREARFEVLRDPDQWTVSGEYRALRPLFKFSWPDGEQVYVSAKSGEVVQHTTRDSRLAAYFGAIPHWLYWTTLRKNGPVWNRLVIWSSGIGSCAGLLGLIAGLWMYSPGRRYRYRGQPSGIPYSGPKRWHMILGLTFGALACLWAFSGLLSMEPFEWLEGNSEGALRVATALRGGALSLDAFAPKPPGVALQQAGLETKELDLFLFDGAPHYLARQAPQMSRIVPVRGNAADQFDRTRILQLVAKASQPAEVGQARVVSRYEAYYLDRRGDHPLPAFFVRMNDDAGSMYYIDLKTASLVEEYDRRSRWNRWLYHGLHSWNLPWLYSHRPAWDIMVMLFLLGGTSLSVTGVILGFQLLRRKTRFARPTFNETRVHTP